MFLGWQLSNDLDELQTLSAGHLEIDVLNGKCTFNSCEISSLSMPLVLNDWFVSDLKQSGININEVDVALLSVDFDMNDFGLMKGKKSKPPVFHCNSRLEASGNIYTLEYVGEQESTNVKIT